MELKLVLVVAIVLSFILLSGWAFKEKSEKGVFTPLRLLPNWMKYVGLAWITLSIILPYIFDLLFDGKNYLGIQSVNLGLLVICLSKDKFEDEMTNMVRLKSFYGSIIMGFGAIMVLDVLEVIIGGDSFTPSFGLVAIVLSTYLISFNITKSKIRKGK